MSAIFDAEAHKLFAECDRGLSQFAWAMSIDFDEDGNPDTNHTWSMPTWGFYVCWDDGGPESGPHLQQQFIEDDGRPMREQIAEFWAAWDDTAQVV